MALHGIFGVFKQAGVRSYTVVSRVKRLLRENGHGSKVKVGHGGTLDEFAQGVLVIGIGNGCKRLTSLLSGPKSYRAIGKLGETTDTLDIYGDVIDRKPVPQSIDEQQFRAVLQQHFRGPSIEQIPPLYSSLKIGGKRASDRARSGENVVMKARQVKLYHLDLLSFDLPYFTIEVSCGGGFYIRSLVRDIALHLDNCAVTCELIRTVQGPFTIAESSPPLPNSEELTYDDIVKQLLIEVPPVSSKS